MLFDPKPAIRPSGPKNRSALKGLLKSRPKLRDPRSSGAGDAEETGDTRVFSMQKIPVNVVGRILVNLVKYNENGRVSPKAFDQLKSVFGVFFVAAIKYNHVQTAL
jgi:hypothetical protein